MDGKGRERSVGQLLWLYTIVISLATVECLRQLLSGYGVTGKAPGLPAVAAAISFLATVAPMCHGVSRYLDATYLAGERQAMPGALLVDAVMVALQAVLLVALAILVQNTTVFFTLLAFLFILQVAWVWLTDLTAGSEEERSPEFRSWALVNVVAAALVLISLWSNLLRWSFWPSTVVQALAIALVAVGRTTYEYVSVWSYYYPAADRSGYIMPAPRPAPVPRGAAQRPARAGRRAAA